MIHNEVCWKPRRRGGGAMGVSDDMSATSVNPLDGNPAGGDGKLQKHANTLLRLQRMKAAGCFASAAVRTLRPSGGRQQTRADALAPLAVFKPFSFSAVCFKAA